MTLKAAVVGVGAIGANHARVYADLPDVSLVGVADTHRPTAQAIARRYGTVAYADFEQLMEERRPDIVSLAVPTYLHHDVGLKLIARGVHLLIEKPIALTVEQGQALIDAAARQGILLTVGHIERFNPSVTALKARLAAGELGRVFQMDARRQGPFPERVRDVGVVVDLAVHDLDVMRHISGAEIVRLYAETQGHVHGAHEELLTGLLRLSNGAVGTLTISWLTPTKIRELLVTGERGMFRLDYITQDLYFYENALAMDPEWETMQVLRGVSEGRMIRYPIVKKEPLRVELEAFCAAVREHLPPPVSGADGLQALALAQMLVTSGLEHRPIVI
ncbi:MAG: Gfo/Idh/MocA family oxidoreductase [Chloroflexi bacterium]|nr:Gfo/Idh/MocA family oxidoreductase [Chloroflexota bacterium]